MIRIIDATLTKLDDCLPTREQFHEFIQLMKQIGIIDIAISMAMYEVINTLPEGFRFYLHIDYIPNPCKYQNIYKYIVRHGENGTAVISEYQMNDVRELVQLRAIADKDYVALVGLDDLLCYNFVNLMEEIKQTLHKSKIVFCPENTYHLATALAVQWILLGGTEVLTTFAGYGNQAATEEVLVALRVIKRHKPNQNIEALMDIKQWIESITGVRTISCKPIIGSSIFSVESGIHVDGIIKNPNNYQAFSPNILGEEIKICLGKHSGSSSIQIKLKEYGIVINDTLKVRKILKQVKRISMKKRDSITDREFLQVVQEVIAYEGNEIHSRHDA